MSTIAPLRPSLRSGPAGPEELERDVDPSGPVGAPLRGRAGEAPGDSRLRLVDAALRCLARSGVTGTTLDDVSREAGCSRATVYRSFPGGKEALLGAVLGVEVERFFAELDLRVGGAPDLGEALVQAIHGAGCALLSHAALRYLLDNEPELVLPLVSFSELERILWAASEFASTRLALWMADGPARRTGELVARIVVSYVSCPSEEVDLQDEGSVRRLVAIFVLPAVTAVID